MKLDKQLSEIFNTTPLDSHLPVAVDLATAQEDDFDLARNTLRDLILKNNMVISDIIELAKNSEHPRAFEVAGQLIKTQSEIAKDLMEVHQQKKDLAGEEPTHIKNQQNIVFAGSTSDLMKMISAHKAKTIDSE